MNLEMNLEHDVIKLQLWVHVYENKRSEKYINNIAKRK